MSAQPRSAETQRRIRATVRAVLSSGVWLVISVQAIAVGLWMQWVVPAASADEPGMNLPTIVLVLGVVLVAYTYVMSGTFRSFAVGTATVSAMDTLNRGKEVFSQFMWLWLKVLLLGLVVLYSLGALIPMIGAAAGKTTEQIIRALAPGLQGLAFLAPFVFVYWLPVVFVKNNFRVLPTVRAALLLIWQRLTKSSFLAFLVFVPLVILWLLPDNAPLAVLLTVSVFGQLMAWIANIYCVEAVLENPGWVRGLRPT
ncbi:MAG: hypothetical protein ACE5K1_03125 [Acidiferrobacterales bacterium]